MSCELVPSSTTGQSTWWRTEGKLTVRQEPETSAETAGHFLPGDSVLGLCILSDEWLEVDLRGAVRFESEDCNTEEQVDTEARGFIRMRNRFRELLLPAPDAEAAATRWTTQIEERTRSISWLRPPPRSEAVAAQYNRPLLQGGAEEFERRWELQEMVTAIVSKQDSLRNYRPEDLKLDIRNHFGNPAPSWLEPLLSQKSVVVSMLSTAISQLGPLQAGADDTAKSLNLVANSQKTLNVNPEIQTVGDKVPESRICRGSTSESSNEARPDRVLVEGALTIMSLCADTSHFTEVLGRVPWDDFPSLASACRTLSTALKNSDWRRLLEMLAEQHGLLLPRLRQGHPAAPGDSSEWQNYFFKIWASRNKWCVRKVSHGFRVRTIARLRPGALSCKSSSQIFLPLHQRLQLVKLGLDSNFEDEVAKRMGVAADSSLSNEKFQTSSDETSTHARIVATEDARVLVSLPGTGLRYFDFEHVFDGRHCQSDVYVEAALPGVEAFLRGFSACVLCYGQTGSGKTFTMFGGLEEWISIEDMRLTGGGDYPISNLQSQSGLAARAIADIFSSVAMQAGQLSTTIEMSYIEIYQDHLTDLFSGRDVALFRVGQGIAASEYRASAEHGEDELYHLQGAEVLQMRSAADALQALALAEQRKHRAATALNARSSRAHSVLMLGLRQRFNGGVLRSRLHLVDLGGSEQVKKSKVEGLRFDEAVDINSSLMVLGRVVDALMQGQSHVPYYESKLTMLLQPALGGNAHTTVIITASPSDDAADETVHSFRFGERCSRLTNAAHAGTATMAEVLASLVSNIAACEAELATLEAEGAGERAVAELGDGKLRGLGFGHNESRLAAQSHDDGTSGKEALLAAAGNYTVVEDIAGRWIAQQDRLRALRQRHREIVGY